MPFSGQKWPVALRLAETGHAFPTPFPIHSSPQAPRSGMYAAIESHRDLFRAFVLDNLAPFDAVVDRAAVEQAWSRPSWTTHEFGALVYLVLFCGAQGADWTQLRTDLGGSSPYPEAVYANVPPGRDPAAATLKVYQDILPKAIFAVGRDDQARLAAAS